MRSTITYRGIDRCVRISLALILLIASVVTPELAYSDSNFGRGGKVDGYNPENCDETSPPENCEQVEQMAYKSAMRLGYADSDGNQIPDVMERGYTRNWNDCTTGNAHVACMWNEDPCTAQFGEIKGLRSNSAHHATTKYIGKDGREFECDFTPGGGAGLIGDNADTTIGDAVPDAGESMDPAYSCKMNGANHSQLNPGGKFGGSSMQDMMSMMMLMQLLQQMKNRNQNSAPQQQAPTPAPQIIIPTPTPTPTETPTAAPSVQGTPRPQLMAPALDQMTLPATEFPGLFATPTASGG